MANNDKLNGNEFTFLVGGAIGVVATLFLTEDHHTANKHRWHHHYGCDKRQILEGIHDIRQGVMDIHQGNSEGYRDIQS